MRAIVLTAILALAALPALAVDAPTFTVLKTTQGDDVTFLALPSAEAGAKQKELRDKAKKDHAAWEAAKEAFHQDKANAKKVFRDPEPAAFSVSVAKAGFASQADADAYAEDQQKKADGKYAVVKITSTDGANSTEIILMKKIRGKEKELEDEYLVANDKWQAGADAFYANPANTGANPPRTYNATKPTKPKVVRLRENLPDEAAAQKALDELKNK